MVKRIDDEFQCHQRKCGFLKVFYPNSVPRILGEINKNFP